MLKKLHFKSLLLIAVMLLGGASAWGAKYSSVLVFDCADASQNGSTSLYGVANTATMGNTALQAFLNKAAGVTNKITVASGAVTGSVYWAKGSGGTGIPSDCLKVGKASGAGAFTFSIDDSFSKVDRVVITGYGWKNTSAISVNSSESQTPTSAATETTFTFDLESSTRTISVSVTTSAVCITSIELFAATTDPEITASDVALAYNATSGEIPYTITNPSGATLTAAKTTGDWISNVTVDGENNKVTFNATVNTGAQRNGTITLSYTGADDKVVTVTQAAAPVAVTGITLDPTTADVEVGGTVTLTPNITPANATNQNVTWSTSDPSIATVANGVVTGVAVGTATITATTEDGPFATCVVTVKNPATPTLVYDFTNAGWNFPDAYVTDEATYTNGLSVKFGESSNGHKAMKSGDDITGVIFGKLNATLSLSAFPFNVSRIKVYGISGASGKVTFNVFVGAAAASTEVTGATGTQVFDIAEDKQTSGNIFTIKVTNDNNCQISRIEVFGYDNVPVGATGFATYCSRNALDFSDVTGLTAYTASLAGDVVTFNKIDTDIPNETGVLLKGAAGTYKVPVVDGSTTNVSGNKLVGVIDATGIDGTSGNYYVLKQNAEGGVGFYKVVSANYTVRANSAYLDVDKGSAKGFIPVDGTTAIELVDTANEVAAPAYNLQGQRVSNGYKGVVIVNGKKIMMK